MLNHSGEWWVILKDRKKYQWKNSKELELCKPSMILPHKKLHGKIVHLLIYNSNSLQTPILQFQLDFQVVNIYFTIFLFHKINTYCEFLLWGEFYANSATETAEIKPH